MASTLSASIVVVNEFSVPELGGKGSRGGTPGDYVTRYMARQGATETMAPITKRPTDDFIMRYMARESAVERAPSRQIAKTDMRRAQGHGGVAFGYGSVSLSDEQLRAASRDIQHWFDQGHTVLKTVISFDQDYLKCHGLIPQDFECRNRGDYRGHLDQMKLRMALMHGLDRMSRGHSGFDDLRYVAVIQIDTEHVHCHLAMVDAGPGRPAPDGTQRGKLSQRHTSRLRRGIDAWLDEHQHMAHLSSAVGYERRNVTAYIKRWAHERMQSEALPQFLLACLPADRSLWRAGSHHAAMRKPNRIVRELVTEELDRPGSPLPAAMDRVRTYADQRTRAEDLSPTERQRLIDRGYDRILQRCVNGVYGFLRALPQDELFVRTPMLDVMGMDDEQLALAAGTSRATRTSPPGSTRGESDDLVSFGFRLRSYSSRLDHHRSRHEAYRRLARDWERLDRARVAPADSRAIYDFYRLEEEYHQRCMAKYRHFLPFAADPSAFYDEQREVADYGQRLLSLIALRADASLQRMKDPDAAERLGREIYDQPGGAMLTRGKAGRAVLDERVEAMRRTREAKLDGLRENLASCGLVLRPVGLSDDADDEDWSIQPGATYPFEQVKALDLHHLTYDFAADLPIGTHTRDTFVDWADRRRRSALDAADYLEHSGQSAAVADLPLADVTAMGTLADDLAGRDDPVLVSRLAQLRRQHQELLPAKRSAASCLDDTISIRLRREVDRQASADGPHVGRPEIEAGPADIEFA